MQFIMGCSHSENSQTQNKKNQLVVATLNYGGILNSPLQFFSDSQQQQNQISSIFRQLIPQYVKNFDQKTFKWDVGKIDQKVQKQRYSPIYRPKVGVQNDQLIGQSEFYAKWDQAYQTATKNIKIQPQPTSQQIQNMKLFDLICYHALLKFIYKINSISELQKGKFNPQKYIQLTQKYFNRSYLSEQKKIKKVKQALTTSSADVFCFQQPTQKFIDEMKKDDRFFIHGRGPQISMILIRKSSFDKINERDFLKSFLTDQQYNELNWDGDTSFIVCDSFILISAHLSSKKQKNANQVREMKKSLNILRKKCPNYHIIVGADTNSFVQTDGIESFYGFPNKEYEATTCKKRTYLQPQFNKADIINQECKDQIFSTLTILKKQIVTIENEEIQIKSQKKTLLPTQKHPFDHFMVVCTLLKSK